MNSNETDSNVSFDTDQNCPKESSNWNSNELDPETIEKLKGDSIGDTVYSESFVLKTLLELSDLKWTEKLEEDLCFLWDMTVEAEVCEFLIKMSFPSIAATSVAKYDEERFVEIMIGILGNLASKFKIDDRDVINSVLVWLQSDDHLILIQVMRFMKGILHFESNTKLPFFTKEIIEKFECILSNSINKDLLVITLDVLTKITTDFKVSVDILNKEIINSVWIGYQEISKQENREDVELINTHSNDHQFTLHFVQFILNICLYTEEFNCKKLLEALLEDKSNFSKLLSNILIANLNLIDFQDNPEPIDDITEFYIESFAIIFPVIKVDYTKDIFNLLINVISDLIKNSIKFTQSFIDLFIHFIIVSEINDVIKDIGDNLTRLYCIIEYCERNNNEYFKNVNKINVLKKLLKP